MGGVGGGMVSVVMREHPPYMMNGPIEYEYAGGPFGKEREGFVVLEHD